MTGTLKKTFRHEAFFYAGYEEFLHGVAAFVREGLDLDEPTLVLLGADKLALLRGALGEDATAQVTYGDMAEVGHNPARIIPAWFDFAARFEDGRALRGVGEPVGPHRRGAELVECSQHEFLLNLAFAGRPGLTLLCPYDTSLLAPAVITEARCNHPVLVEDDAVSTSATYRDPATEEVDALWGAPLPEFDGEAFDMKFDVGQMAALRSLIAHHARRAGLDAERTADLVLSVNELAANSIQYGGGSGTLRIWLDGPTLICEVHDDGHIEDPLVGRRPPGMAPESSRGLWVINQLCDLVQVRSSPQGTVVRVHVRTDGHRRVP